jgi:hypothetical protein
VFCIGLKSGVLQFDTAFWVGRGERLSKALQFTFAGLCLTLLYFTIWLCNLLPNIKGVLYWSEKRGLKKNTLCQGDMNGSVPLTNEDLNIVHCQDMYWFFLFCF